MSSVEDLEGQRGILRVLVVLVDEHEVSKSDLTFKTAIYTRPLNSSISKLGEMGLVNEKEDRTTYPVKHLVGLTWMGMEIAKRLKEVDEILKSESSGSYVNSPVFRSIIKKAKTVEETNKNAELGKRTRLLYNTLNKTERDYLYSHGFLQEDRDGGLCILIK